MLRYTLPLTLKYCIAGKHEEERTVAKCQGKTIEPCLTTQGTNATTTTLNVDSHKSLQDVGTKQGNKGRIPTKEAKGTMPCQVVVRRGKRRVMFQDQVEIAFTLARQDISHEELGKMWYSSQEYENILRNCIQHINILNNGNRLQKDQKYCFRGLESNSRFQAVSKLMNRNLVYEAVFREQGRQYRDGVVMYDAEAITKVYSATSNSCQLWAHVVGLADQRAAEEIHDECNESHSNVTSTRSKNESTQKHSMSVKMPHENSPLARAA
jgi:hypothetical protein